MCGDFNGEPTEGYLLSTLKSPDLMGATPTRTHKLHVFYRGELPQGLAMGVLSSSSY